MPQADIQNLNTQIRAWPHGESLWLKRGEAYLLCPPTVHLERRPATCIFVGQWLFPRRRLIPWSIHLRSSNSGSIFSSLLLSGDLSLTLLGAWQPWWLSPLPQHGWMATTHSLNIVHNPPKSMLWTRRICAVGTWKSWKQFFIMTDSLWSVSLPSMWVCTMPFQATILLRIWWLHCMSELCHWWQITTCCPLACTGCIEHCM